MGTRKAAYYINKKKRSPAQVKRLLQRKIMKSKLLGTTNQPINQIESGIIREDVWRKNMKTLQSEVSESARSTVNRENKTETFEIGSSTSTAQHVPSSSQKQEEPNAGCSDIQNVEPGEDIPLELEVFEESNIEESKNKIDDTTENTILFVEIDESDMEKPKTGDSRKRTRKPQSGDKTATRTLRPLIGGIKINFDNVDTFGEQITFLLKKLPRQLCRELQDTIVTLIKTATEKHEHKTKKNVSAKKVKTAIPQPEISPTLANNTKHTALPDVIMREYIHTYTFPKPMNIPIELSGSMDCVKQEILDPEDSNDSIINPEQYDEATTSKHTLFDHLKTNIKIDIDETNLIEQAKRRENSQDKYV